MLSLILGIVMFAVLLALIYGIDAHMTLPLAAFIAHMSGADFFGLVVSVLVCAYLLYALLRGEKF